MHLIRASAFAVLVTSGAIVASLDTASSARQLPARAGIDPRLNQGPKAEAIGGEAMVSTQLPIATEGALKVLREGGNAVDAMVTAAFLQSVHDYHQSKIFGSMSAIGYDAASRSYYAINAVSQRPLASRSQHGDASKVAIAGKVRGLKALADKFGTRRWASYVAPATADAREGAVVSSFMYGVNYELMESGELANNRQAFEFYMPDGFLPGVGQRWKMPKLAETLERIAADPDYFYTGAWAKKFVEQANRRGYAVTIEDMAEYTPQWQEPVRFTYRGHDILASPPPDTGGLFVGYSLNILENFDLKAAGPYWESAETLEVMARTFGRVEAETRWGIADPLNSRIPSAVWLSKDYGRLSADYVRATMPVVNLAPPAATTAAVEDVAGRLFPRSHGVDTSELGSNHNVIVDRHGNWISMLHTSHGGAPGILIDGVFATGSDARAFTVGPGRRLVLPITSIIVARDGVPWLSMGTPGNPPQPVTQVLVNILDFGLPPAKATDAPRFWALRSADRAIEIESRVSDQVRQGIAASGLRLRDLGTYNWHTGSMQIVWRDSRTGKLHGVTDPRRLGLAAGY